MARESGRFCGVSWVVWVAILVGSAAAACGATNPNVRMINPDDEATRKHLERPTHAPPAASTTATPETPPPPGPSRQAEGKALATTEAPAANQAASSDQQKPVPADLALTEPLDQIDVALERSNGPLRSSMVVCEFQLFAIADTVLGDSNDPHASVSRSYRPLVIVYSSLDTKNPVIKGNGGEAPLFKVQDDGNQIVMVETNAFGNVFTHTISRQRRRGIYAKSYFGLSGQPFAQVTVGVCR